MIAAVPGAGSRSANAITTAVYQACKNLASYGLAANFVEIAENPRWPLIDELVLAVALSAEWLDRASRPPGGGG